MLTRPRRREESECVGTPYDAGAVISRPLLQWILMAASRIPAGVVRRDEHCEAPPPHAFAHPWSDPVHYNASVAALTN